MSTLNGILEWSKTAEGRIRQLDECLIEHQDDAVVSLTGHRPQAHQVNLADDPRYADQLALMEALLLEEMKRLDDPYRLWDQEEGE